jgi:hypothetical protein
MNEKDDPNIREGGTDNTNKGYNCLGDDGHLSFDEIASAWSGATSLPRAMMMEALVNAFWRGEFECDGVSSVFAFVQPDSVAVERSPGNYATSRDGIIVKVGDDFNSYVTAERKQHSVFRHEVARVLCGMPDYCPWLWDGSDEGLMGLSTIAFETWPSLMRQERYSQWRIRRDHFAQWYRAWPLSSAARLEQFWADPATALKQVPQSITQGNVNAAENPRRPRKGPAPGEVDRYGARDEALFDELERIMCEQNVSRTEAARQLSDKIPGHGTPESREKRLAKRYGRKRVKSPPLADTKSH